MKKINKFILTSLSLVTLISSCNSIKSTSIEEDLIKIQSEDKSNFMWGVSTAGYQSEGYDTASMWNTWVNSGKTPDKNPRAVDFFHRYEEDIQLAKDMGCNAFRLSIEWSRIEPQKGVIDPAGIQYYKNVIKAIKDRGMTPLVTLIHFNYPQWVANETKNNGLADSKFIDYFLKYVAVVVKEYKSDVKYWLTFNEPNIWIPGAYLAATFPPGKRNPISMVKAGWNLLKAHSIAYDLIHGIQPDAMVSSNMFYILPKPFGKPSDPNNESTISSNSQKLDEQNMLESDWFFESLDNGKTTVDKKVLETDESTKNTNLSNIAQNLDKEIRNELKNRNIKTNTLQDETKDPNQVNASMDSQVKWLKKFDYVAFDYYYRFRNLSQVANLSRSWLLEIYPEGLYDALMDYNKRYKKPILIAENGISFEDGNPRKDKWTREAAMVQHIKQVKRAMKDGANVLGYFHWSITDNYEWGSYTARFGLYTVNSKTDPDLKRIPTPAVDVYKKIISEDGVTEELLAKYPRP
ncbi:MAG: glycoside hydrolase family 1 protein [Candidatus Sericytochromatia bacterium]